jgi:hypothetical protein
LTLLLCLYAALLLASLGFTMTRNRFRARLALTFTPVILCGIILLDRAAATRGEIDLSSFDDLALAVALPLFGLALMAVFVTRWHWLFWLVLTVNMLAGAGIFYLALRPG